MILKSLKSLHLCMWVKMKVKKIKTNRLEVNSEFNLEVSRCHALCKNNLLQIYAISLGKNRASLVAQWLRICLSMQGTQVRALVWEDLTCRGATGTVSHNYWACASGACAPQQERPRQWEARAPQLGVAPARSNWRKPSHRNEDPTQPKINK